MDTADQYRPNWRRLAAIRQEASGAPLTSELERLLVTLGAADQAPPALRSALAGVLEWGLRQTAAPDD